MVILPFEHEEETEERTLYNTAVCLKSSYSVADAVFLIENQRYVRKDFSLRNNIAKINELIVEPFYNLLCAGEEKKVRHIGAKMLDAGDIIQTLSGWTAIGYGKSDLPLIRLPFELTRNFRKKSTETHKGVQAMDEAISELSIRCDTKDAIRALYLLTAPAKEMNMDLVKELDDYLHGVAPEAVIRNGDYPRERGLIDVVVILSQLRDVERVRSYYTKSATFVEEIKKKQATMRGPNLTEEAAKDIPTLL
jgi:cell division GTPase FtsZ